jgi:hypothetical protein
MTNNTVHFWTAGSMGPTRRCSVFGRNPVQGAALSLGTGLHVVGLMFEEADPFWNLMRTVEIASIKA